MKSCLPDQRKRGPSLVLLHGGGSVPRFSMRLTGGRPGLVRSTGVSRINSTWVSGRL